ncbi:MAG: MFS transporter [Gemmatimonadota bacterium]
MNDSAYRRLVRAWAMYDWANSAFATTVMAALFPLFFRSMARASGVAEADATAYWGYTTSAALVLVALLGPVLGSMADHLGCKKPFVAAFAGLGIAATILFVFLGERSYRLGAILYILGDVGFAGANIFYESLLPHVARRGDMDRVSARGYAMGYIGGGLLLVVNLAWMSHPDWFFMPGTGFAMRASFLSVAAWWAVFSLPLLRHVPEPRVAHLPGEAGGTVRAALQRLRHTAAQVRRYRHLVLFLAAFWLYNDGIGTIQKMALAYGDEIGIDRQDLIAALVITQFVGVPAAFAFGHLAGRLGSKRAILLGLAAYSAIAVAGYFMRTAAHFYGLAFAVGLVQGGTQALSRSLFGAMVPRSQSAEFFGFFSTSSKFAGIIGPVVFGVVSQVMGSSRLSIVSLVVLFVAGAALLTRVDVAEGIRVAEAEDAAFAARAETG